MFYKYGNCGGRRQSYYAMWGGRGGGFASVRWGERGDSRGRRGRVFDSGELRLVLLKLIADEPRHGYDLIRAIEEMTGGAYAPSPGVVYPTLTLLEDMGLIEEAKSDGAKKQFAATETGMAELADKADTVKALLARLTDMGTQRAKTDGAPIQRAMANLCAVLQHRLSADDVKAETLHDVAAILDDAAQKIERL